MKREKRNFGFSVFRSILSCASIEADMVGGGRCETFFGCLIGYSNLHTDCTVMWLKRLWVWFLCLHILAAQCLVSICRHSCCRWATYAHTHSRLVSRQPFSNSMLLSDLTEATRVSIQTQVRVFRVLSKCRMSSSKLFVFVGSMCVSLSLLGDNVSASRRLPFFLLLRYIPLHSTVWLSSQALCVPMYWFYRDCSTVERFSIKRLCECRVRIRYFCRPKNLVDFIQVAKCYFVCSERSGAVACVCVQLVSKNHTSGVTSIWCWYRLLFSILMQATPFLSNKFSFRRRSIRTKALEIHFVSLYVHIQSSCKPTTTMREAHEMRTRHRMCYVFTPFSMAKSKCLNLHTVYLCSFSVCARLFFRDPLDRVMPATKPLAKHLRDPSAMTNEQIWNSIRNAMDKAKPHRIHQEFNSIWVSIYHSNSETNWASSLVTIILFTHAPCVRFRIDTIHIRCGDGILSMDFIHIFI